MYETHQWIPVRLVPRAGGKVDKIPLDYRTGEPGNAHDPALWLRYEVARSMGGEIGFVLTANDPYFCIDLDNVAEGDRWSQEALDILASFPHCYREISQSGRGMHIIGRYEGPEPVHQPQPEGFPGGIYTSKRFIHITGRTF